MNPESNGQHNRGELDSGLVLCTPRNDGRESVSLCDYGRGTLMIGLRCASATTVAVPIGPCSS